MGSDDHPGSPVTACTHAHLTSHLKESCMRNPRASVLAGRLLAVMALAGFALVIRHVLTHDHSPGPGLSARSWATIASAAMVLVLLRVHRRHPIRRSRVPLTRAAAEYATVALLAVLLVSAPTPTPSKVRAPARPQAPADTPTLVGLVTGARDWADALRHQVAQATATPTKESSP